MKTIICTTGTSAAKNINGFNDEWVHNKGGIDISAKILFNSFRNLSFSKDRDLMNLSAEIHSLSRIGISENDRVYLFTSDTLDGQCAAKAVELYLKQQFPSLEVKIELITGLQVNNENTFRRIGVVEFIKKALQIINNTSPENCILNPTGGFKSLVPYTTLLGMFRQIPVKYIFERSTSVLTLPPIPFELARSMIQPLKNILEKIDRETSVPFKEWLKIVTYTEQNKFESLIEKVGDDVTLSAIGSLVLSELQKPIAKVPYISRVALEGIIELEKRDNCNPRSYLLRVASDKNKFENDLHGNMGYGLSWLKPGNTTDRYLISIEEDWRLLIWEAVSHEEYERHSKISQYSQKVLSERANKHAPFMRLDWIN